ncbi:MAG: hypothetical protein A4E65_02721 [Syntrophorhabdus sp. PtaU1.Bin153]|nr:MAG: hypothetical protein A4E65_02721 [Syntrophorhabdus sp. PtaU1.Bin153]
MDLRVVREGIHKLCREDCACLAVVELQTIEGIRYRFHRFDDVRTRLAEVFQGEIEGRSGGSLKDTLELLDEVLEVHEGKTSHEGIDSSTSEFQSRRLKGHEIVSRLWPSRGEASPGEIAPLLTFEVPRRRLSFLGDPVIDKPGPGDGADDETGQQHGANGYRYTPGSAAGKEPSDG